MTPETAPAAPQPLAAATPAAEAPPRERPLGRSGRARPTTGFWRVCRVPLLVGLAIRLVLAPWTATPHDVQVWYQEAVHGIFGVPLYARPGFTYPPVWALPLRAIGVAARWLGFGPGSLAVHNNAMNALTAQLRTSASPYVTTPGFNLAYKSVLIAFDLGTAWLVWRGALRLLGNGEAPTADGRGDPSGRPGDGERSSGATRMARRAFMLWWLSPLVIFETSVHGAFDVIVAFFALAAIVARIEGRFVACGAALALGILTKVSPAFLLPLLLVTMVVPAPGERWRGAVRNLSAFVAAGVVVAVVVMLPTIASGHLGDMLSQVSARTGGAAGVGGVGIYGFTNWSALANFSAWAANHGPIISHISTVVDVVVAVAVAAAWLPLRHRLGWRALVLGAAVALWVPVLVQGRGQPQYLVWFLPFVCILAAPRRWAAWGLIGLGVGATLFEISVLGPLGFLSPLAVSTGVLSIQTVVSSIQQLVTAQGLVAVARVGDLELLGWVIVIASTVVMWVGIARSLLERRTRAAVGVAPALAAPRRSFASTAAVSAAAAGVALALVVGATSAIGSATTLAVSAPVHQAGSVSVGVRLVRSPAPVRAIAFGAAHPAPVPSLYVYEDARYPMAGSTARDLTNTIADLRADLRARGDRSAVRVIDADGLATLLRDVGRAPHRAVVLATGTLPAPVWSTKANLLAPWIGAGGTVIWAGDPPGLFSVQPGPGIVKEPAVIVPKPGRQLIETTYFGCGAPPNAGAFKVVHPTVLYPGVQLMAPQESAVLLALPFALPATQPPGSGGCAATVPTRLASALEISYPSISSSPTLAEVHSIGGLALGYVARHRTSVAWLPAGGHGGGTLLFGSRLESDAVASDVVQALQSGVLHSTTPVATATLSGGQRAHLSFPLGSSGATAAVVAGFDVSLDGTYFEQRAQNLTH